MINTGAATNGDNLEECTTNVFALADARGLRWKKYSAAYSCPTLRISDDPVLSAYSKVISQDVLCVWQRSPQPSAASEDPNAKLLDWSKELVIFWYGEEPILAGVVNVTLKEIDCGCFDDGLPVEYQNLFFKALHNLLERYLLGNGFICTGKWFAKPLSEKNERGEYLAFSFNFFIYGESLVATIVDVQKKPSLRKLMKNDLTTAANQHGDMPVVLSPYGLSASVTGHSLSINDIKASKLLDEWSKFYPALVNDESTANGFPPVVEVIRGETRMLYPSNLVLVPIKKSDFDPTTSSDSQVCSTQVGSKPSSTETDKDEKENLKSKERRCLHDQNNLVNAIWEKMEGKKEKTKGTQTKAEGAASSTGNNKPLWDFKDPMRHIGCGCTSSSNVSRSRPMGRFGTNWSQPRSNSSPAVPSPSSSQCMSNSSQRTKRDKKKISLPFHQRRSTSNERSSTPPIAITRKLRNLVTDTKPNLSPDTGKPMSDRDQTQFIKSEESESKLQPTKPTSNLKSPVESSKYSGTSKITSTSCSDKTDITSLIAKYHKKREYKKQQPNYSLPKVHAPRKPVLAEGSLEPRTELTDPSFKAFLSLKATEESMEASTVQILSPPIASPNPAKSSYQFVLADAEVKIEKIPNQGIKRTPEVVAPPAELQSKKIKLEPPSPLQIPPNTAQTPTLTETPTSLLPPTPTSSETSLTSIEQPQPQQPAKRGPGRPRRSSSARAKDESAASNTTTSSRGGRGRPRKGPGRPSKKDQSRSDSTSENSRSTPTGPPSVESRMTPLPSPPMPVFSPPTPRLVGMGFRHQKDLMARPTDLDHLFESDEEGEDGNQNSLVNGGLPRADQVGGPGFSSSDDITKLMHPQSVTSGLPHDLAQMFPTPPSQEPPTHATSPATSVQGEYLNPSITSMHLNVLSPEKHPVIFQEKESKDIKKEVEENEDLASPFQIPEYQELPWVDSYSPLLVLPSKRYPPHKFPDTMKYQPSWETGTKSSSPTPLSSSIAFKFEPLKPLQRLSSQSSLPPELLDPALSSPLLASSVGPGDGQVLGSVGPQSEPPAGTPSVLAESGSLEIALTLAVSVCENKGLEALPKEYGTVRAKPAFTPLVLEDSESGLFVDDRSLPTSGKSVALIPSVKVSDTNFRPVRPKTLALPNVISDSLEPTQQVSDLSDSVLEIFKDQWSSPFSACYLTNILRQFYLKQSSVSAASPPNTCNTIEYLRDLSPNVQEALHKSLRRSAWDVPKVEGPLNFRSLQKLAGKTAQQSGVPVHPLLVGSDGDWASISPVSLRQWQKLMLEPFGGPRDVAYVVVSPESDFVLDNTKQFFKELGHFYESMNLGRHCPISTVLRDGIMRIGQKSQRERLSEETVDEWFSQDDSSETARLKFIAQVCKGHLGPHLAQVKLSSSLFDKDEKSVLSPTDTNKMKGPSSPGNGLLGTSSMGLTWADEEETNPPAVVVYMIDPFHVTGKSSNKSNLWSFTGLMRAFAEMLPCFSNTLRNNVILQIIPLECILQFKANSKYHVGAGLNPLDTRQLALSVYSRCRLPNGFLDPAKAITCFSIATTREKLFKKKQEDDQLPSRLYTPPCILAPMVDLIREDIHSPADMERIIAVEECDILFCAYCLSSDRKWILVTCSDKSGTLSETCLIKVSYTARSKRRTSCPRILALRRLWDFIISTISFSLSPWRIILSRLGRPGTGELKDLNEVVQKEMSTQSVRRRAGSPQPCHACSLDATKKESPSIQSISFTTTELETSLKLLPVGCLGRLRIASSRIFVVPAANQSLFKSKDIRNDSTSQMLAMNMPHSTDLSDSDFMLPSVDDEDGDHDPLRQFLPLLHSPSEPTNANLLPSPQSDINRPVFSPSGVTSPRVQNLTATSPFQPIKHRTSAFKVVSPVGLNPPVSSVSGQSHMTEMDLETLCRQSLAVGYHISGKSVKFIPNSIGCGDVERPSIIKTELLLHVTSNDSEQSTHPLDAKNHLQVLRFILEQLDALSWLTVDPSTGERQSPLASHIYLLCNFYETFNYLLT